MNDMPHRQKVVAGDVTLHCLRTGAGPDVVMIHGLGANLAFWQLRIAPRLAREFRVTTYDLRGHGYSDAPAHGYSGPDMAADLLGLLDALQIRRAHLVAHSFGADVALRFTIAHPERVATLTLVDAVLAGTPWTTATGGWAQRPLEHRLAHLGIDTLLGSSRNPVNGSHADGRTKPLRVKGGFQPFGLWQRVGRAGRRFDDLWARTSARDDLLTNLGPAPEDVSRISQPTLIVVGARSRYRRISLVLARTLPNCQTAIVPGAGHFHPMVRPVRFARVVRMFLYEHERSTAGVNDIGAAGA